MLVHPNIESNTGRGSILYIHKSLLCKQVHLSDSSFEESVLAEINLKNNDKLLCGLFYRRGESTTENNEMLLQDLKTMCNKKYSHVLCMGDFNLPGIDWKSWTTMSTDTNSFENKFIEAVRDSFLFQHIVEPTRCRGRDTPHTLDLILTNEENMIDKICIDAPLGKSDHAIIKFSFIAEKLQNVPQIQTLYHKGNYKKIGEDLDIDWQYEMNKFPNNVDKQWNYFKTKYEEAVNKYVPKKVMMINGKTSKKFTIPLSQSNLKKIKQKNRLWSKMRKNLANEEIELEYNRVRNQVRRLTRKSNKIVQKKIAKDSKSNPKSFWKFTQSKLKTKTGIPDLEVESDEGISYTTNDTDKANVLQTFFSSVFTEELPGDMPYFEKKRVW